MDNHENKYTYEDLLNVIARLRGPDGCPWDKQQTHESLRKCMIEEAYETVEAINLKDDDNLKEELGDVLLQVVMHARIAGEAGRFDMTDVVDGVTRKMIRRHPHVFGSAKAQSAGDVLELWDSVKLAEKDAVDGRAVDGGKDREGLLDGIPTGFPALMQAQKISRKAVSAGFEWDTLEDVWGKVDEEIAELRDAFASAPKTDKGKVTEGAKAEVELEFGDVLFTLVNVARKMGVDAESALRASSAKFRRRWAFIEGAAWEQNRKVEELSMDEMQALWDEAKERE